MNNLKMSKAIEPYFKYYARKYKPFTDGSKTIIEIPVSDGSHALDYYFINVLIENGFKYHENFLLSEIYLIKGDF